MATSPKSLNCRILYGARSDAHGVFESLHHLLAILALIHVDEVDHDDAAQVAQPDLPDDFLHRLGIGLDDGVFQTIRPADVLAGVHVDRHQRFGLVDHDVSARFQPHLRTQRLFELGRDIERVENRLRARVEFDARDQARLEALHESKNAFVQIFVVYPNVFELFGELVAQRALHDVEIVMQQQRRRPLFRLLPDIQPQVGQEIHVGRRGLLRSCLRPPCGR